MAETEIRFLGDLQRLDLKKGDRFVLTVGGPISLEMHDRIQETWKRFVGGNPDEFQLLILDRGMKLGVINGEAS